jgi:hypothetical protein
MLRRVALVKTDVPQKLVFLQEPHGVTSQKTQFYIWESSSTVNMEAACYSETSVDFQQTAWRYTLEDEIFGNFRLRTNTTSLRSPIRDYDQIGQLWKQFLQ